MKPLSESTTRFLSDIVEVIESQLIIRERFEIESCVEQRIDSFQSMEDGESVPLVRKTEDWKCS